MIHLLAGEAGLMMRRMGVPGSSLLIRPAMDAMVPLHEAIMAPGRETYSKGEELLSRAAYVDDQWALNIFARSEALKQQGK